MPDITMCENHACLSATLCERQTATPSEYQSFDFFEGTGEDGTLKCGHYRPNEKGMTFTILSTLVKPEPLFQSISRVFRKDGSPKFIKILDLGTFPLYYKTTDITQP